MVLENSPLGKKSIYKETYAPDLLCPIPRKFARDKLLFHGELPYHGSDIWNAYELSWLNSNGKPEIALGEFIFDCNTSNIVESKSLKLYLNSLNYSYFDTQNEVKNTIEKDLRLAVEGAVGIRLFSQDEKQVTNIAPFPGRCIDDLNVSTNIYQPERSFLKSNPSLTVTEKLYSNLLKCNCLATGQPDWGSLFIHYSGPQMDHRGLLKYIISHRSHSAFAEYCVEQIFCDLMQACHPEKLSVYARFTRRGGLDINPFRSNFEHAFNIRLGRQ